MKPFLTPTLHMYTPTKLQTYYTDNNVAIISPTLFCSHLVFFSCFLALPSLSQAGQHIDIAQFIA